MDPDERKPLIKVPDPSPMGLAPPHYIVEEYVSEELGLSGLRLIDGDGDTVGIFYGSNGEFSEILFRQMCDVVNIATDPDCIPRGRKFFNVVNDEDRVGKA